MYKRETIRIHKAWKEIKRYINKHKSWIKGSGAEDLQTIGDFKEYYLSARQRGVAKSDLLVTRSLKSYLRFKSELGSARTFKGASKKTIKFKNKKGKTEKLIFKKKAIEDKSLKELRGMSTREFADLRKDEIKDMYHRLRAHGMDGRDAAKEIASFYFGS